jgi:ketosteroid isomerase-like protein
MKAWIVVVALVMAAGMAFAADKDFESVANAYVEDLLKMNPEYATLLGDHRYDAQLTDRSAAAITAQAKMSRA